MVFNLLFITNLIFVCILTGIVHLYFRLKQRRIDKNLKQQFLKF